MYADWGTVSVQVDVVALRSLALGGVLAAIAILIRREITFVVIMGVFIVETLSVIIQIFSIKVFKKKVFLMTPLHHNFEKLGWQE